MAPVERQASEVTAAGGIGDEETTPSGGIVIGREDGRE